jgi:hypothetical protein
VITYGWTELLLKKILLGVTFKIEQLFYPTTFILNMKVTETYQYKKDVHQ